MPKFLKAPKAKSMGSSGKKSTGAQYLINNATKLNKQTFIPSMSNNFAENIAEGVKDLTTFGPHSKGAKKPKKNVMTKPLTHTVSKGATKQSVLPRNTPHVVKPSVATSGSALIRKFR